MLALGGVVVRENGQVRRASTSSGGRPVRTRMKALSSTTALSCLLLP